MRDLGTVIVIIPECVMEGKRSALSRWATDLTSRPDPLGFEPDRNGGLEGASNAKRPLNRNGRREDSFGKRV